MSPLDYSPLDLATRQLHTDDEFERVCMSGSLAPLQTATNVRIVDSLLLKADLSTACLEKFYLTHLTIETSIFVNTLCHEASWHFVEIKKSRLTGCNLMLATLSDCSAEDCALNLALFRFSTLKHFRFVNCNLKGADFTNASLTDVKFENCTLDEADFTQASLKDVDLRSSSIAGMLGGPYLKGAVISSSQLMQIAHDLALQAGIQIQDE